LTRNCLKPRQVIVYYEFLNLFIKGLTTEVNAYIYGQLELMKMRNNKMNDIAQLMFFIVNAMV